MGSTTSRSQAEDPAGDPLPDRSPLASVRRFLTTHRRRLSRLLVVLLVVAVGAEMAPNIPHDAEVEFALGTDHGDIVRVQVGYLQNADVFHSVRFDYPMGAPGRIVHRLSLPQGAYDVTVDLEYRGGRVRREVRRLDSPVEGRMRLLLEQAR